MRKVSVIAILAGLLIAGILGYVQSSTAYDVTYNQSRFDSRIGTVILSSRLVGDNLIVKFYHNSNADEAVDAIGAVDYSLSARLAAPKENVTLTVRNWKYKRFELKVASETFIFAGAAEEIERIDAGKNLKSLESGQIRITSPNDVTCEWRDPASAWKHCTVILEINNTGDSTVALPNAEKFKTPFKYGVKDSRVDLSYSTDYTAYIEDNTTKHSWQGWQPQERLASIPSNSLMAVKLIFDSPIATAGGKYQENQFNFTLNAEKEITLDPSISACADLPTANATYTLTASTAAAGTCFTVSNTSVTLNCAGYTINYSQSSAGYGVYVGSDAFDNATIKNCRVFEGSSTASSHGIYFLGADYGLIQNNSVTTAGTTSYGIYISTAATDINVTNNTVVTAANTAYGIYFDSASTNAYIKNNTVITSGNSAFGIYIAGTASDINVTYNNVITSGNSASGIYLVGTTARVNITNNIITANNGSIYGILLNNVMTGGNLSNNIVTTFRTSSYGIYFSGGFAGAYVANNTINMTAGSSYGMYIYGASTGVNITNNIINVNGSSSYGMYIDSVTGANLTNNTITARGSSSYGIYLITTSTTNNNITNSIITANDSSTYGIYFASVISGNNIYNNYINTTGASVYPSTGSNNWNRTLASGTNIICGSNIGGNFYANATGTGFSETCTDADSNGICDSNMTHSSTNIDYLPLSAPQVGGFTACNIPSAPTTTTTTTTTTVPPPAYTGAASSGFAIPVEGTSLRLAFHIGNSKSDDTFAVQDGYVLVQDGNVTVSMIPIGTAIGTQSNANFSLADSLIESRGSGSFIMAFSNTTNATIISKLPLSEMPGTAFAPLSYAVPAAFPIYVKLEYPWDIISRARLPVGNSYVLITNLGKDARGITRIAMTVP